MLRPFPRLTGNNELPDYRVLNRLFEIVERLDNLRAIAPMFVQDSPTARGIGVAPAPPPPLLEQGAVFGAPPECTNAVVVQTTTAGGSVENVTLDLRWPVAHPVANKNFIAGDELVFIRYQPGGSTGLAVMSDIDGVVARDDGVVVMPRMDEFNVIDAHGKDYAGNDRKDFDISANPAGACSNPTQFALDWNGVDVELFDYGGSIAAPVLNGRRLQFYNQLVTGVVTTGTVVFGVQQVDAGDNKYAAQITGKLNTTTVEVVTGISIAASATCNDDGTITVTITPTITTQSITVLQ